MSKQKIGAFPAPVKLSKKEQEDFDLGVQAIKAIMEEKGFEFRVVHQVGIAPKKK